MESNRSIIFTAGTLDGSIFCLKLTPDENLKNPVSFKAAFVDANAHSGSVKSLAMHRDFVISGSNDDIIQLYSISLSQNIGCVDTDAGTINSLRWAETQDDSMFHFFSGSEDGSVSIWKFYLNSETAEIAMDNIRSMKRHTNRVRSIAVHPSNKVCLSISDDKTLRVWDLMHGRQSYVSNIKSALEAPLEISFSTSGLYYLISWNNFYHLVRIEDAKLVSEVQFENHFTAPPKILYENEKTIFVVLSTGKSCKLLMCPLDDIKAIDCGSILMTGKRVKSLDSLEFTEKDTRILVLSATDADASYVRAYKVDLSGIDGSDTDAFRKKITLIGTYDVENARITKAHANWHSPSYCPLLSEE